MTPLEIEILLHYHARCDEYQDGDFSAPAVRRTIDAFRDGLQLIRPVTELERLSRGGGCCGTYKLTERGEAHVRSILAVPLPILEQKWVTKYPPTDKEQGT